MNAKSIVETSVDTAILDQPISIERMPTGVRGLDDLMEGGLPKNSMILVTGKTGTGKTTLGLSFLMQGIQEGEPVCFVTLEESIDSIVTQLELFGWPAREYIREKKLTLVQPALYDFEKLLLEIEDSVVRSKSTRLVIDSISIVAMYFQNEFKVRRALLDLEKSIKKLGCTSLLLCDMHDHKGLISVYGVEEYVVDGVIALYLVQKGRQFDRALMVHKMHSTNHSLRMHPAKIEKPYGFVVHPKRTTHLG
ncbi:MAG: ATPase domain-containing protein [Candidatus Diapherotrites archaeon]|nr:ATPase domain-containing protein [Candidatus Diapherotrites archaeon]